MKVVEVCTCVVFQCILVGGRDSIGEAAVERPCRQASVSLLWWQPKKVIYCNSSSSQTTSSIPSKFNDCYRIAGFYARTLISRRAHFAILKFASFCKARWFVAHISPHDLKLAISLVFVSGTTCTTDNILTSYGCYTPSKICASTVDCGLS